MVDVTLNGIEIPWILDSDKEEVSNISIPNWINSSEELDQNVFTRKLQRITYTFRATDSEKYTFEQLMKTHSVYELIDIVEGFLFWVWIESIESEWTSANSSSPWQIDMTLISIDPIVIPPSSCPMGEQCDANQLDQTFSTPILGSCFFVLQFDMSYNYVACSDDPFDGQCDLTVYYSDGSTYSNSYFTDGYPLLVDFLANIDPTKYVSRILIEPYTYNSGSYVSVSNITCYTGSLPPIPPTPPSPVTGGRLCFNVCKPYYYNGWYYIFYYLKTYAYIEYYTIFYAKSQDLATWDTNVIVAARTVLSLPLFGIIPWACMCIDDKVVLTYSDYDGVYKLKSLTGTIQVDGSITFGSSVLIRNGYGGFSIKATKISGNRKFFVFLGSTDDGWDADCLFISDDDGATWSDKGYSIELFGMNYEHFNFKAIPLNDGNKLIELIAPPHWALVPPYDYSEHKIYGEYRNASAYDTAIELGDYLYAYGIPALYTVPPPPFTTVYSVDSGAEGCKLGNWVHVAYVDLYGNVQHKRVNTSAPDIWENIGEISSSGTNNCASPVADATNSAIYIFYADDYTIYYRRWTETGGLESETVFYTVPSPDPYNTIDCLTVYPDVIDGKIMVAWMQKCGIYAESWEVYCLSLNI